MKNKKQIIEVDEFDIVIDVGFENKYGSFGASYYSDMSGSINILNDDGEEILCREDGGLKWQIQYAKEALKDLEKRYVGEKDLLTKSIKILEQEFEKQKNIKYMVQSEYE